MSQESGMSECFFFIPISPFQAERIAAELETGIGMPVAILPAADIAHMGIMVSPSAVFFLYTGVHAGQYSHGTAVAPTHNVERERINALISAIGTQGGRFVLIGHSSVLNTIPRRYAGFWYGRMNPERVRSELPDALRCIRCGHVWCSSSDLKSLFAPREVPPVSNGSPTPAHDSPTPAHDSPTPVHYSATTAHVAPYSRRSTPDRTQSAYTILTPRQREVAALVRRGTSNIEIAQTLNISLATVKSHVSAAMTALNVANRTELAITLYEMTDDG
ncbi:MAG: LuxR C-terminal-related transcriptional regulator [Spirochaetota bacterium]